MRTSVSCALLAPLLVAGCSGYEPRPLEERAILDELQKLTLERAAAEIASVGTSRLDPRDGLSEDEAVVVALHLNPDLNALRREKGVAEGEVVAAGILPNPELQVTGLFLEGFTKGLGTAGFDVGLSWAPPRPGELGARQGRARARLDEVGGHVAWAEWQLATDTRKAHRTIFAAEERLRFLEASVQLRGRIRKAFGSRERLGDTSRLDLSLVELEYLEGLRERTAAEGERARARQELNRLLGLPPTSELVLQREGDPLAWRPLELDPAALESILLEKRPDLRAARAEYEQAEAALHLACLRRIPWFTFGPGLARDELDGKIQNRFGLTLGLELPLANLNEGEIAVAEATRERLRRAFVAKVHQARAEVAEALRNVRSQERVLLLFQESIRPALEQNAALTDKAFERGELDLLQLVATQDKVLKSHRDQLEASLEHARALLDLERALGERVSAGRDGLK